MSATTCPWPAPARARACCSASTSGCRPTKGDSPRATATSKRRRRAVAPTSSKTSTGSARPLTGTGPRAVAHDLVDRALVAVHGGHQALQHRVEQLARFLGVAVGQEFHGALEVGEQHRDLFALAFQGAAGGENFLGQI